MPNRHPAVNSLVKKSGTTRQDLLPERHPTDKGDEQAFKMAQHRARHKSKNCLLQCF